MNLYVSSIFLLYSHKNHGIAWLVGTIKLPHFLSFRRLVVSPAMSDAEDRQIEQWKVKRLVKMLDAARGNLEQSIPKQSMYGIFTYIYHILPLKTTKCR